MYSVRRSRAEVEPPRELSEGAPAPAVRSEDLEPGSQRQYSLDDFELIRVIGRGSYAKVYTRFLIFNKLIYELCLNKNTN